MNNSNAKHGSIKRQFLCVTMGVIPVISMMGCSSVAMNSNFACGVGEGLGCKSVSEVNDIVENSHITNEKIIQSSFEEQEKAVYSMLNYHHEIEDDNAPNRTSEKRIKIWFAPHVDVYDNYVEETVIYAVIKEPKWVF